MPDRASEFPSVAPQAVGKPHQHAYAACSRIVGDTKWGPQQVPFHPCAFSQSAFTAAFSQSAFTAAFQTCLSGGLERPRCSLCLGRPLPLSPAY